MDALDLLTARLFDYAGTFPPATLPFKDALRESARSGLLVRPGIVANDMVVASPDLKLVTPRALEQAGFGDTQCGIALVGIEAGAVKRNIARVKTFNERNAGSARINAVEVHGSKFESTALLAAQKELGDVRLFVEPQIADRSWIGSGWSLIEMLGKLGRADAHVGLKVRGSGPNAISNRTLAQLIPQIVTHQVPLKATAGLHHPLLDASHGNQVGFLNVASALRLRQVLGDAFGPDALLACLYEQAPDAYNFDHELAWRGHAMSQREVAQAVDALPFGIGTCDMREPDSDLARLFGDP